MLGGEPVVDGEDRDAGPLGQQPAGPVVGVEVAVDEPAAVEVEQQAAGLTGRDAVPPRRQAGRQVVARRAARRPQVADRADRLAAADDLRGVQHRVATVGHGKRLRPGDPRQPLQPQHQLGLEATASARRRPPAGPASRRSTGAGSPSTRLEGGGFDGGPDRHAHNLRAPADRPTSPRRSPVGATLTSCRWRCCRSLTRTPPPPCAADSRRAATGCPRSSRRRTSRARRPRRHPGGPRPFPRPRALLAPLQPAGPRARRGPRPAAPRAGPLPGDLHQQPRRVLHGPGGRPQAPDRDRARRPRGCRG